MLSVIPFNVSICEMYHCRGNRKILLEIQRLVISNMDDYCLVHLFTLMHTIKGYTEDLK